MEQDMMLDLLPVKDDGVTSCFDVQLQAVGIWKKTGYELMYLDNWKYVFREEGFTGNGIWTRGRLAPRLYFDDQLRTVELFEKYHGVKIDYMEDVDAADLREIIDHNLLSKKSPVLIAFDTYYIPWLERFYEKIHSNHIIMVMGKRDKGYLFNDTRPFLLEPAHGEFLDWEVIEKGFAGRGFVFDDVETDYDFNDIRNELTSLDFNMFHSMRQTAVYLRENGIDREDLEDFDGGNGILIRAFRNIVRSRAHYLDCLKYVQKKYGLTDFGVIIDEFAGIVREWDIFKNLIYKLYLTGEYNERRTFLSDKMSACGDMEERAANDLLGYMRSV